MSYNDYALIVLEATVMLDFFCCFFFFINAVCGFQFCSFLFLLIVDQMCDSDLTHPGEIWYRKPCRVLPHS